jgi:hypothetical protein
MAASPFRLVRAGEGITTEVFAWGCEVCKTSYSVRNLGERAQTAAAECCAPCCECGKPRPKHRIRCDACDAAKVWDIERAREEKAAKVSESTYNGPVYWEDGKGDAEGYFSSTDEVREWCEDEGEDLPEAVWACTVRTPSLNADDLIEQALDESYEGCDVQEEGFLREAIAAWNAKQTCQIWNQDYSTRVVLIPTENSTTDEEPTT